MKTLPFRLLAVVSMVLQANTLEAQWVQTNGPYGEDVYAYSFTVSGTNLFAGTWGGVFLSTDNGTSWTAVNSGLTEPNIMALAVNGTSLFAGTESGGVFRSTNNGASWTAASTGLTNTSIRAFASNGTNLFAGTLGGVFLSTNDGTNWTAVNSGLTSTGVSALAVIGANLFAGTWGGVFRSTNNGTSWTEVNTGLANTNVQALAVIGTNLFAGTANSVFLSTNNGTNWVRVISGMSVVNVQALAASGTTLYAGTFTGGVYRSTNNGTSWTAVNSGLTYTDVRAVIVSGGYLFAGTWSGGVFRSTNNGTNWTAANSGLGSYTSMVNALCVSGTNLFAGTSDGVSLSTNDGTQWTEVNSGLTKTYVYALAASPSSGGTGGTNLFVGTYGGGVSLSTNNGASWTAVNSGLTTTDVRAFAVSPASGGTGGTNLFAGGSGGVFRSTDQGTSWTAASTGLTTNYASALAVSGTNLFAGTTGVFISTDDGTSWTAVKSGLTSTDGGGYTYTYSVYALAVSGTYLFAGTSGHGVFLSTNNGTNWTPVNSGMTTAIVYALAVSGGNLFAGTRDGGVFRSTNNGTDWTAVNSGLKNTEVHALAVGGTYLFAGTSGGGVYRRPLSEFVLAPAAPTLVSPSNGATGISTNPTLSWNASTGATSYQLQLSTNANFSTTIFDQSGITGTSEQVSGLATNTLYYWRVNATNAGGTSSFSSTSSFTTIAVAPTAPMPASPSNGATGVSTNPTLSWKASVGATSYQLQISTSTSFSPIVVDQSSITTTSFSVSSLANNTLYYWRVNASNTGGTSSYSSAWSFTTTVAAPMAPTLASPADNAINVSLNPILTWNACTGASRYHLQVSTMTSFTTTVFEDSMIVGTARTIGPLSLASTYYWRVRAINSGGGSAFSPVWGLSTIRTTSVEQVSDVVPREFILSQNHPNPFNPTTTIRFALPRRSYVTLEVSDALGRRVATLVSQELGPGYFIAGWNAVGPSGIYFYRFQAGAFMETKKMILLH